MADITEKQERNYFYLLKQDSTPLFYPHPTFNSRTRKLGNPCVWESWQFLWLWKRNVSWLPMCVPSC